ncbi:MAG: SagB/ThcOx family dehydrogenase [Desulfurococcaceae archaeon]
MRFKTIMFTIVIVLSALISLLAYFTLTQRRDIATTTYIGGEIIYLPLPRIRSGDHVLSVEEAIAYRRSIREYLDQPITIQQLSQILWATYGVTDPLREFKTVPSAGATYPLEIYVVVKTNGVILENNEYLEPGVYKYDWRRHALILVKKGDFSRDLMREALNQEWVGNARVNIVIAAVFERTTRRYGDRGVRYVYMEVGHAGQNVYLISTSLGLGCVVIGAFNDDGVSRVVGLSSDEKPLYIISIGVPKTPYRVSEQSIHNYILNNRKTP